mmetsp:Transcript_20289/g.64778  ORF Transcript_20289/g.64778 Transcript_20289/m.64778 type:complete len:85 (+) Transcript_20289:353-607(+)
MAEADCHKVFSTERNNNQAGSFPSRCVGASNSSKSGGGGETCVCPRWCQGDSSGSDVPGFAAASQSAAGSGRKDHTIEEGDWCS